MHSWKWTQNIVILVCVVLGVAVVEVAYSTGNARAQSETPVMIGGDSNFDACGSVGQIAGLDPEGDNYLSVRAGPSGRSPETNRLHELDRVYICDDAGPWIGIVYGQGTCGVTGPVSTRRPYNGGCRSGWIFGAYVELIAG